MKRIVIIALIVGLLVVLKLTVFSNKDAAGPKPGPGAAQGVVVSAYVVNPSQLDHVIEASGSLTANEQVELNPEVSGKVTGIYFKEGEFAKKGDLLVKLNDEDLQAQLRKAQSALTLATERVGRMKELLSVQGTSQEEYDVTVTQEAAARADVEVIRAQIRKTEIRAPFNGRVGLRYISEGAYVMPGSKVATLQQTDPLKIDFSVPERYTSVISINQQVEFRVGGQEKVLEGKIYAIEPRIDQATRSLMIRAICNNESSDVLPGAFARVRILVSANSEALMIPTEAVIPILKGQKVFISKGGKASEVKIETGERQDAFIEVTKGLNSGDTVITTGIMSLREGSPLKVKAITNTGNHQTTAAE